MSSFDNWIDTSGLRDLFENPPEGHLKKAVESKNAAERLINTFDLHQALWRMRDAADHALMAIDEDREPLIPEEHLPAMGFTATHWPQLFIIKNAYSVHILGDGIYRVNGDEQQTLYFGKIPTLSFARQLFEALGITEGGK